MRRAHRLDKRRHRAGDADDLSGIHVHLMNHRRSMAWHAR